MNIILVLILILIYNKVYECIELDDIYDDTIPSSLPSSKPSLHPSYKPSSQPTLIPSSIPSSKPSLHPLSQPTTFPSSQPTSIPSLHPTIHPPTSHPTPPLKDLGKNWWYLVTGILTLYGSEIEKTNNPISEDKILQAAESSIKFVLTDELIDKEEDAVIINIENYNEHNKNRILLSSNNYNDYDDDNYDSYKDLILLSKIAVYAWCSEKSTALKLKSVFRRINKRPLLIIQPMHMNNVHSVTYSEIDDISITVDTIGPAITAEKFSPERIIYVIVGTIVIFIILASLLNKIIKHHRYLKELLLFLFQLSIDAINEIIHIFSQLFSNNDYNSTIGYNLDSKNKNKTNWQELKDDDVEENQVKFTINYSDDDNDCKNDTINPIFNQNDEQTFCDNNGSP